jgi:hypothetical protein
MQKAESHRQDNTTRSTERWRGFSNAIKELLMKNENKVSAALLNDLSCGYGLAQAIKKNDISSVKDLQDCAAYRPALKDKLGQRFGRDWATTAAKVLNPKQTSPTPPKTTTATPVGNANKDEIIAKLKELGIGFHPNTGIKKLQVLLDNALAVASAQDEADTKQDEQIPNDESENTTDDNGDAD